MTVATYTTCCTFSTAGNYTYLNVADLSHELSKISLKFSCPWSQHVVLLPFQSHGYSVELSGKNFNALNVWFPKRFKCLKHSDYLSDLQKIMPIVIQQVLKVRMLFKFKIVQWTAPFWVGYRSPQTCKKSASLKPQRTSFQVFPLFVSLFSGSKTDTPDTSRYSPAKRWVKIITIVVCYIQASVLILSIFIGVIITCIFLMMSSASWSHIRLMPLSVMYDLQAVTIWFVTWKIFQELIIKYHKGNCQSLDDCWLKTMQVTFTTVTFF